LAVFLTPLGGCVQGRLGPQSAQCDAFYNSKSDAWSLYDSTKDGIQKLKVKTAGYYRITAYGARGGEAWTSGELRRACSGAG
jgi:hypothetical protein